MILLPRQFSSQPQLPTKVDWDNPITRGIVGAWTGSSPSINIANGRALSLANANGQIGPSNKGMAFKANASANVTDNKYIELLPNTQVPTAAACATIIYKKRDNVNRDSMAFGAWASNGDTNSRFCANVPYFDNKVYFVFGARVLSVTGLTVTENIWSFNNTSTGLQIWQDGISRAQESSTVATRNDLGGFNVGFQSVVRTDAADTVLLIVHNRELAPSEIVSLAQNPWQVFTKQTSKLFFVAGAAAQTITPSLYTNEQTFYSATVSPGAVTLSPSLFTNTNTFYSPTVSPGAVNLSPSLFTNDNTFYSAFVTLGGVVLQPSLYTNDQTFYSPTVTQTGVTIYEFQSLSRGVGRGIARGIA